MRCPAVYLEGMKKSLTYKEKLWFLKQIDINDYDMIVDFGCATGSILSVIDKLLPKDSEVLLCDIDNYFCEDDMPMLEHRSVFLKSLDGIKSEALRERKVLLILSSVLHEVSYKDLLYLIDWSTEFADTIVCRDMFFPEFSNKSSAKEGKVFQRLSESELNQLKQIKETYNNKGQRYWFTKLLYEFFLKYTYKENWESEVKEVYLCNNAYDFCMTLGRPSRKFNPYPFNIKFFKTYTLPYKKKEIKKKFGYRMRYPTHIKFILEKEKDNERLRKISFSGDN